MSRFSTSPFRTPRSERVEPGPWAIVWGGRSAEDPVKLDGWDYATDCSLTRALRVDVPGVLADCSLPAGSVLATVVQWWSSWTNLRGCRGPAVVDDGSAVLRFDLGGRELGGVLRLETRLVLHQRPQRPPPLAPHRPGSILWRDVWSVTLEGEAARFPLQLTDFANLGAPGAAEGGWYLQWVPEDLEASALGSIRLLVNSRHPTVGRLLEEGGESTTELRAVLSTMRYDVARQLVHGALDTPGFDDGAEWPPRTVGAVLRDLLLNLFPGESIGSLRSFRELAPALFDARIQAATRLFHDM